ncbi:MAG TPA: YidC/Oxa1 family membrane protein insertase [Candidatus Saccharibacteria bacterium]|nr:YidC/Oxa1 family membrane protein insertase [Candidatus Saccharibacteria bacterium]HMR38169.1 YidC/Oxa1 family membrane protein insertase [Candidatus Saccharibacteria bacterium]
MNIFDLLIIQPVFNLLMLIYSIVPGGDFGVTIIIFTLIMRFAMYPLVKKQLHQTKMMRKLQPELKKIKKNAKGNKQLEAMQMMDLYKRHGVSPFRSIGILLLQLPIFIGLYYAVQILALRRDQIGQYIYGFLENIGPIAQLIQDPDQFNHKMLGFIDLTKHAISNNGVEITLLILAVLSAVTQYIMSKQISPVSTKNTKTMRQIMAEASEGKQADQTEMNEIMTKNMMKFMPVMMFIIMINLPGAIAFYYMVSNLIAVVQQHYLLKQDETELEEIAEEPSPKKQAEVRADKAKEARVTRIVAKDSKKKGKK